jgi:leader peptidase (prepilin peptidase) / N-methyltransferase
MDVSMIPHVLRLIFVFLVGVCLGSIVNWAIYALAWTPRPISPWSPSDAGPRRWLDRLPVLGWISLRRESHLHGSGFWIRPMLLEVWLGVALAGLYWWEVVRLGLMQEQLGSATVVPPYRALYLQFISQALLLCWMLAASFVDIDEKIIPDEITVTGTLVGLILAAIAPMSLLPHVAERARAPVGVPAIALAQPGGGPAIGMNGNQLWLEPMTAVSPDEWPPQWGQPRRWQSLTIALGCYWLWCFALAPRIWRGRRGPVFAMRLIASRLRREFARPPLRLFCVAGTVAIVCVWAWGTSAWAGLLTALIGLVASGGIVWAVRLMGTAALRREAMGFGDVTLMMMIGTFLGWQACLITFFISPFAALVVGILQFVSRRDDVIPYGPFLCLAAATIVVFWGPIWMWGQPIFQQRALVALVLAVCVILLGLILGVWRVIKGVLFGNEYAGEQPR